MSEVEIPFEIHLTTVPLTSNQQSKFVKFCLNNNCKPLVIELAKGDFSSQPMLSIVLNSKNINDVFRKVNDLSESLNSKGFPIKRVKIEIPSIHFEQYENFQSGFEKYF